MRYSTLTDPGKVREINEDNYYADGSIFIVADGMGGHQAGEVASTLAIETFLSGFTSKLTDAEIPRAMEKAMREANTAIFREAAKASEKEGMGTTCTAAVFQDGQLFLGHVGDSRAYLWMDGNLEQLTEDHSLVAELVRSGRITEEQALRHPQRNIITRALGIDENVHVDIFEAEVPDRGWLLLCTDGLNGMISDERISEILSGEGNPDDLAGRLVEAALESGGSDNVTVVLADISTYDPVTDRPAAVPAPEEEQDGVRGRKSRRLMKPLLWGLLALCLVLLVAALFIFPLLKNNSYFVGVDEQGYVTLYQGFPWRPLGIDLKSVKEASRARAENLEEYRQENLRHPVTKDLEGARIDFEIYKNEAEFHRRVPELMGRSWQEAQSITVAAMLRLRYEGEKEPDPADIVIGQNPASGELVELETVIYVKLQPPALEKEEEKAPGPATTPESPQPAGGGGGA